MALLRQSRRGAGPVSQGQGCWATAKLERLGEGLAGLGRPVSVCSGEMMSKYVGVMLLD